MIMKNGPDHVPSLFTDPLNISEDGIINSNGLNFTQQLVGIRRGFLPKLSNKEI